MQWKHGFSVDVISGDAGTVSGSPPSSWPDSLNVLASASLAFSGETDKIKR